LLETLRQWLADCDTTPSLEEGKPFPHEELSKAQRAVRTLLRNTVGWKDQEKAPQSRETLRVEIPPIVWRRTQPLPEDIPIIRGPLRDCLLMKAIQVMQFYGTSKLGACDECDTIFVKDRRDQRYHSRECRGRAGARRFRETAAGKTYEQQWAKTRRSRKRA